MKLGIIGLSQSGKKTVFEALTKNSLNGATRGGCLIATVPVPDDRINVLSEMYQPRKTTYAQVEYFLPGQPQQDKTRKDANLLTHVRDSDALIQVIRNFHGNGCDGPAPADDFLSLSQELIFADLMVVEKRLERLDWEKKRGKSVDGKELNLLAACRETLENDIPLRRTPDLAANPLLRGYALLSAKPLLALFNNEDHNNQAPDLNGSLSAEESLVIKGKLEQELAHMADEEAHYFLREFNLTASAMDRVIKRSYELLGLISFFTVGEDEVRAWTVPEHTEAVDAAEVIHSDIKKGFIRAEVLSYADLIAEGSYTAARKKGLIRLQGKAYQIADGDIINFRFNV